MNTMNDREEKFMFFYMEQTWNEMRHLEDLRERVSVLILTIASIISGFIVQQGFSNETKIMMWFVIVLGVVGVLMVWKLFQIHQMGQKRLDKWNEYLENNCGSSPKILTLRREADLTNKKNFWIIAKIPHNVFWLIIHFFIIGIGILMLTMAKQDQSLNINKSENKTEIIVQPSKTINQTTVNSDSIIIKSKANE